MSSVLDEIAAQRVLPVIRTVSSDRACVIARACVAGGMHVIELTESIAHVERTVRTLSDEGHLVGVGTITDARRVPALVAAGARFVVSFTRPAEFVAAAKDCHVLGIPGAFTPTEIAAAIADGAEVVKLFPAGQASPAYLRGLASVGLNVPIVVTGGIPASAKAIKPWLAAGALAAGAGSDLIGAGSGDDLTPLTERVRCLLEGFEV